MDTVKLTDLKRKDFGSVEHRKDVAKYYHFQEQEVLDLPKREFKTLIIGIIKGNIEGKFIAGEELKQNFFMVPINMWKHREEDFKKILEEEINELKANKERNDDSTAEEGSEGEGETENSEEQ